MHTSLSNIKVKNVAKGPLHFPLNTNAFWSKCHWVIYTTKGKKKQGTRKNTQTGQVQSYTQR